MSVSMRSEECFAGYLLVRHLAGLGNRQGLFSEVLVSGRARCFPPPAKLYRDGDAGLPGGKSVGLPAVRIRRRKNPHSDTPVCGRPGLSALRCREQNGHQAHREDGQNGVCLDYR